MRGYIINERRAGLRGYFTFDLGPESATRLSGLQLPKLGESSSFFSWSSPKHCLGWKVVISRPLFEGSLSWGQWLLRYLPQVDLSTAETYRILLTLMSKVTSILKSIRLASQRVLVLSSELFHLKSLGPLTPSLQILDDDGDFVLGLGFDEAGPGFNSTYDLKLDDDEALTN